MDPHPTDADGFKGTSHASVGLSTVNLDGISRNSTGTMTDPEITPPDGWTMLNGGKWLGAARLFGISESVILSSLFVIGIIGGILSMAWMHRHERDWIDFQGHHYRIIAMAQMTQNKRVLNCPLYEEVKNEN